MKALISLSAIILLSCSAVSSQDKPVYANDYLVKVGDKAPDFTVKEAGGKSYKLSDLKGKVVMLQFTASWCSVCRTELEEFDKMKEVIFKELASK